MGDYQHRVINDGKYSKKSKVSYEDEKKFPWWQTTHSMEGEAQFCFTCRDFSVPGQKDQNSEQEKTLSTSGKSEGGEKDKEVVEEEFKEMNLDITITIEINKKY